MEDKFLFYRGGQNDLWGNKLKTVLFDLLDISLYKKLQKSPRFHIPLYKKLQRSLFKLKREDLIFKSNLDFWAYILNNKAYVDQYITLSNFCLTEWLPMSPGLFHTDEAKLNRYRAGKYIVDGNYSRSSSKYIRDRNSQNYKNIPIKDRVAVELNPDGKESMVLGGFGALRLQPKKLFDNEKYFLLGASSNGICHEGIPVIIKSELYLDIIQQVKENSGLRCDLIGKLIILPTDEIPVKYNRIIPKFCLAVEEIRDRSMCQESDILVSVAITYSSSFRDIKDKKWSFVSFNPDKKDTQLIYSVEWLHDYAKRYSGVNDPIILGDFDEFRQHFDKVEFSIKDLANGKIDLIKLAQYEDFLNFKIINVMGDNFNNISGTVINRSLVSNSFNKVREQIDEESARLLEYISLEVEKSGNKDASELMESFHEEIQKPEPKKSLLKSFWNGIVTAIPALISNADKMMNIIEKVGKIMPN